ncbi:MAG TPA: glucokinase [Bauldia sp.]|nr:glucokinase [Bauldia sp.]
MSAWLDNLPFPILIGDIGGTNARFALIEHATAETRRVPNVHTANYATIDDAIADVVIGKAGAKPKSAVLALAGPIAGDRVPLTNCDWVVEPKKSIARFGLSEVVLLNDFEAQSLALPELTPADLDPIGSGTMTPAGARVVIGPGTGLGAGALIRTRDIWVPVPGEGGHIGLGPVTTRDLEIWPHVERHGPRVTAETLLCGAGMVRLYNAVCASDGVAPALETPAAVTAAGLGGGDQQAVETLALFSEHLGRAAGDVALVFLAYGGVYLAGGITTRIAPVLKAGRFRDAFVDKWPHGRLMEQMATAIIVKEDAALAGIGAFARNPARFGVELSGRRWRG